MKVPSGKDVATVITSVKTYLGFLALSVLILLAMSYFVSNGKANSTSLYVVIAAVLLVDAIATYTVFKRPEALGIREQYNDQFATLLGVAVYNGFHPYLSNLPASGVEEALDYLRATLASDVKNWSPRERQFTEQLVAKIVDQGHRLLKPPSAARP